MKTKTLGSKVLRGLGLSAGLAMTLALAAPAGAGPLRAPAQSVNDIAEKIAQWGLTNDFRLFANDFFQGIGIKGGYRYKVEPSFNDGLFTRYDQYYFNLGTAVSESALSAGGSFSPGLGLTNDLELQFGRQYKDAKAALTALPCFYKNLPFDYERALKGMKVGDYFSMKTNMGVVVSGGFLRAMGALGGSFVIDINAHYLVSGSFQVHALRLPDDQVRLKLVGLRTKEKGAGAGIGFDGVLEIFKIGYFDRRITSLLEMNPLKVYYNDGRNNLFMVDYVVDLKDQETQLAYNQVLRASGDLKEIIKTIKPSFSVDRLKNSLIMDIEPLDKIGRSDVANHVEKIRVSRSFKGSMDSKYQDKGFKIGIKLIRLEETQSFSENKIVSVTKDEEKKYFQLNSFNARVENGFLFSWSQMRQDVKMNAVLSTDAEFNNPIAEDLVISVERRDKRFRAVEFQRVKEQLARTFPEIINSQIDFSGWQNTTNKRDNAFVRYQVVLHPSVLDVAPELSKEEIYKRYLDYLRGLAGKGMLTDLVGAVGLGDQGQNQDAVETRLGNQVQKIAAKLAVGLDRKQTGVTRLNALMELRKESLFLKTGVRFVLELLPQEIEKLKELVHIDLNIETGEGDRVDFAFGNQKESEIYTRLLSIQNLINNDGLDMRLESETLFMSLLQ